MDNNKPRCLNSENLCQESKDAENDRGKWKSKTEFLLSCLGYAIGIDVFFLNNLFLSIKRITKSKI